MRATQTRAQSSKYLRYLLYFLKLWLLLLGQLSKFFSSYFGHEPGVQGKVQSELERQGWVIIPLKPAKFVSWGLSRTAPSTHSSKVFRPILPKSIPSKPPLSKPIRSRQSSIAHPRPIPLSPRNAGPRSSPARYIAVICGYIW